MLNMLNIEGGRYICISREICKYAKYAKYRGGIYMHTPIYANMLNMLNIGGRG